MADDESTGWAITTDPPATGDGDGDGDCVPVERELVTGLDFNSLAEGHADIGSEPPWVIPTPGPKTPIPFENLLAFGHSTWTTPAPATDIAVSDAPTFNEWFEATLVYSMEFTVAGVAAPVVRIRIEADYGAGFVIVREADYIFDVFPNDRVISDTLITLIRPAVLGPEMTPLVRATADIIAGGAGTVIVLNHRQFFVKQCFAKVVTIDINNCEDPAALCNLPLGPTVPVTDNFGGVQNVALSGAAPPAPFAIAPVAGVANWDVQIQMAAPFDPALYTATALLSGVPIADGVGPVFTSIAALPGGPGSVVWVMTFTTPPADAYLQIQVTEIADPTCVWIQNVCVTVPS